MLRQEQERLLLVGNYREFRGGVGIFERGEIQFAADEPVKVADSADGGGFVVCDSDGEEFFGAENDFYGVESHWSRLAWVAVEEKAIQSLRLRLRSGLRQSGSARCAWVLWPD